MGGTWSKGKKYLCTRNLLRTVKKAFLLAGSSKKERISTVDCLMSGLAVFGLKYPSLLQFDQSRHDEVLCHNLKTLYFVDNEVPLNDANYDLKVNFLECLFEDGRGKVVRFTWITDFHLNKQNVYKIARGGRARWKIENETFNTLKNQGYEFEHNYGHGYKYLCHVFANLMMLAFLIDQVQQRCCGLFQAALKKTVSRIVLWERLRSLFFHHFIQEWTDVWNAIAYGFKRHPLAPDTS